MTSADHHVPTNESRPHDRTYPEMLLAALETAEIAGDRDAERLADTRAALLEIQRELTALHYQVAELMLENMRLRATQAAPTLASFVQ